jgi:ABC-type protease/lipase transport system fused ATPase/permease subunit
MIDDKIFFILKRKICYLPKVVSIIGGSIAENVTFGSNVEKININKVKESLTRAGLDELTDNLDKDDEEKILKDLILEKTIMLNK